MFRVTTVWVQFRKSSLFPDGWLTRKLVTSQLVPGGDLTHSQGEKELASGDDGPPLANLWLVGQPQRHWQPR